MARAARAQRGRPTDREMFITKLTELSNQGQRLIGNQALREALDWDVDKYTRLKEQLYREETIIYGRGRGGSIGLSATPDSPSLKLFLSYSHSDDEAKDTFLAHLRPLIRMKLIEPWTDRQIQAGEEWDRTISTALNSADIIVRLISIQFINSDYFYNREMERAMERHANGEARIIPIVYRSCLWTQAPFARLQALPRDAKPITSWTNPDDAWLDVVKGIKTVAEEILANR